MASRLFYKFLATYTWHLAFYRLQSNLDYPNTAGPGQNVQINKSSDNQGAHYYS